MNTATATLLTSSPAQTCIALASNYSYGKQGLPDLPTRLQHLKRNGNNKRHSNNARKQSSSTPPPQATSSYSAATSLGGSVSSKRKTSTGTTASSTLNKKDLLHCIFPASSPYRHFYDDKSLLSSTLTDSAPLSSITKGRRSIPSPVSLLHQNSKESITSSNSTSSIANERITRRKGSRENKRISVIKKKSKSNGKVNNLHLGRKTSAMEKSGAYPAATETEPLKSLARKGFVNERQKYSAADADTDYYDNIKYSADEDGDDELQPKSTILFSSLSSIPPRDPIMVSSSASDDNGENTTTSRQEEENNENCASVKKNEKARCAAALPLLKQRLGYLWEEKMFTDVIFIVGSNRREIEAHRVILASCSQVFQNLLYGEGKPLQSSDEKYILYENEFSEPALEVFIKAMYTNEIPICLTLAVALEVFYATKKYAVIFLEDQVLEHIRQLLTISNVFEALRCSTSTVELSYLAPICWRIVEERTAEVLEYHVENLETHLFARILERDRLSVDEVQLFQYAVRWASNLCKTSGMKVTGKNKRHFMEPLLKHFRFTTIPPNQFNEIVVPSRILDSREILQIQSTFKNKASDLKNIVLPYKAIPRINTAMQLERDHKNHDSSSEIVSTEPTTSFGTATPRNSYSRHNMDGSGDGQQVQMICSDSMVIAPVLGSKVHFNGNCGNSNGSSSNNNNKKGASSSTKLKIRRASTSGKAAR